MVLASGLVVTTIGCGSTGTGDPVACAHHSVKLNEAGTPQAGNCPVDTSIAIDLTAFGRGKEVAENVAKQTFTMSQGTLEEGGVLRVSLFTNDADRDLLLYRRSIPPSGEVGEDERQKTNDEVEENLQGAIDEAFNPQSHSRLTASLRQLEDRAGSDIARALRNAIRTATTGSQPSAAIVLSDGWVDTPELVADTAIAHRSPHELGIVLARLASPGTNRKAGAVAMMGVGQVPFHYQPGHTSATTDRLVSAWLEACRMLATECDVSPEL